MCGLDQGLVSYQVGEIVQVVEEKGSPKRYAVVDEIDPIHGVAVLWEDGKRSWFGYDLWCPLSFDRGFSMVLAADPAGFQPTSKTPQPRGWTLKPIIKPPSWPQPLATAACVDLGDID